MPTANQAPVADRVPFERTFHGDTVQDPMAWMRDHDDPRLRSLVEAENAYCEQHTASARELADAIYAETVARIEEDDVTVPVRIGGYWYFQRTSAGAQYEVYCRVAADGPQRPAPQVGQPLPGEQVLLDGNVEAEGEEFFSVGGLDISPDDQLMAVLVDRTGGELFDLEVRDLRTGEVLDNSVKQAGYDLAWSADGKHLFYGRRDDAWRAFQIWRHELGTDTSADVLVMQEDDELFDLGAESSGDDRWLIIRSVSRTTSEVHLLDLAEPTSQPRLVHPRSQGLDYSVEVDGDRVLVTHNGEHVDFELAWAPLDAPQRENWRTVYTPAEGERVLGPVPLARFTALYLRRGGSATTLLLPRVDGDGAGYAAPVGVDVGAPLAVVTPSANPSHDAETLLVSATSLLMPRTVLEVRADGSTTVLKQQQVPGFDPAKYVEERVWITARDGVQVPLDVARRADVEADGSNPGFLYGYGSYEYSVDPSFSVFRLSLLDRGVVFALAHPRGGGEMGRRWYDDGKMLAKRNTFGDFVDSGRWLVESGWVHPQRLGAEGASAGGLLIGASINEAPDLFRAVHAGVPFVDALTTILDPTLPLTVGEWEEWGNPVESAEVYAYMKSYSPYENITATEYPAILATTSINDTRVSFIEPLKWIQRLRETVTNGPDRPILCRTEIVAGHAGSSGRYDGWKQDAFEYAFVLDQLGVS